MAPVNSTKSRTVDSKIHSERHPLFRSRNKYSTLRIVWFIKTIRCVHCCHFCSPVNYVLLNRANCFQIFTKSFGGSNSSTSGFYQRPSSYLFFPSTDDRKFDGYHAFRGAVHKRSIRPSTRGPSWPVKVPDPGERYAILAAVDVCFNAGFALFSVSYEERTACVSFVRRQRNCNRTSDARLLLCGIYYAC